MHGRPSVRIALAGLQVALVALGAAAAADPGACPGGAHDDSVAPLVAERITDANFPCRTIGGPDAIGGVGDWYLANDVVEVVVD